jgi:hypothetical protein
MLKVFRFQVRPGVDDAEFEEADRRVQIEFAYRQPGLVRRTTARGTDDRWIVIEIWRSVDDADACARERPGDPATAAFLSLMVEGSLRTERYQELD